MEEKFTEKAKRIDAVLGIIVASAIGFLLNLLGNLYYGLFIIHTTTWGQVDHMQIYGIGLLLLAFVGFIEFFIEDYKNSIEINRSLLKRFVTYFFYEFKPGKVIRFIAGLYMLVILLGVIVGLYAFIARTGGYFLATAAVIALLVALYMRERKS